jgi:hypothetical protein
VFAERGLNAHRQRGRSGQRHLYRNFPTRDILIEAAYRSEVAKLRDASPGLLATLPPREALRV